MSWTGAIRQLYVKALFCCGRKSPYPTLGMPDTTFDIDSPAAAHQFQSLLNDCYVYFRLQNESAGPAIPTGLLAQVFKAASSGRADRRLLWAAIGFELTYLFMMRDVHGARDVWARRFSRSLARFLWALYHVRARFRNPQVSIEDHLDSLLRVGPNTTVEKFLARTDLR